MRPGHTPAPVSRSWGNLRALGAMCVLLAYARMCRVSDVMGAEMHNYELRERIEEDG